ncbi:MAG: HAMP domain-containing histidine kinase [Bdellovibrionaceae bacterium]|nr:HAMP domain-containing histidine kinase [Pseudobdellovibrionaceae bacterium]
MNTLRNQMYLLVLLILVAVGAAGFQAYKALDKYFFYQNQIQMGKEILRFAEKASTAKHSIDKYKKLQDYRQSLDVSSRQEALSQFIQAYDEKNKYLIKKRLNFFKKSEVNYVEYATSQYPYLIEKLQYYAVISGVLCLVLVMSLVLFIQVSFLKPIKDLNKKMIDFLNKKYTYQFLSPKNNEVGTLQSTFNSLAQQVLSSMDDLKELDRAKSEFLSIASHELRTPLTSIKGSLSLLHQGIAGPIPPDAVNLVNIANEETDRLIRLINDILDLTKLDAKMSPLKQDWYSLDTLINKTFESISGLSHSAQIKLSYNPEAPYLIFMDFDRVQQILTNLISNAIKFSPKNSDITFLASRIENGHLKLMVKDQGPGIAPDDQELIFQQFRQATSEDSPLVKGTGLGLAIAKALVEQHGGTIGVESTVGQGSTFYFTLPQWKLDMSDSKIKNRMEIAS